jgi:hypothetical protein
MKRDLWIENLFRPLVVAVMVGCVAWSLVQLVLSFAPAWDPTYLIVGCVLAALEASYSYRVLKSWRMLGTNVLRFRLVELTLIFIILRVGRYVGKSAADVLAEVQAWPRDLTLLIDMETLAAFALTFVCWSVATQTALDLKRIGDPPTRHGYFVSPFERLIGRFFAGGAVLLIAIGLARLGDVSELLDLRRRSEGGLTLNVLLYFFLGLVMLGQMRYIELRRRWQTQEMHVADVVARRWVRYSLSLIGLAAFLAFLLPTGFTLGLLNWMANSLGTVISVLTFIVSLIFIILMLPIGWLMWLISTLLFGAAEQPRPEPQLPTFELPQRPEESARVSWLEIVWPLIFWAIVVGVAFLVVRTYLRDRPELREALATSRSLQVLRRGWVAFWQWLRGCTARLGKSVGERLPRRLSRRSSPGGPKRLPFRFFRLGTLSPRERVFYYYLSVLRRAGQHGYPRQGHQTPHEYYAAMEPKLPQAQEDMGALTQAFVEARYSHHEVVSDQEQQVRANWERVKAALRALKRQRDAGE